METGRRVHEMQAVPRKQSTVKRPRHAGDQARSKLGTFLFPYPVVECRQGRKNVIEIIVEKVVQEESELRR